MARRVGLIVAVLIFSAASAATACQINRGDLISESASPGASAPACGAPAAYRLADGTGLFVASFPWLIDPDQTDAARSDDLVPISKKSEARDLGGACARVNAGYIGEDNSRLPAFGLDVAMHSIYSPFAWADMIPPQVRLTHSMTIDPNASTIRDGAANPVVPEPGTLLLLSIGVGGLAAARKFKRRSA